MPYSLLPKLWPRSTRRPLAAKNPGETAENIGPISLVTVPSESYPVVNHCTPYPRIGDMEARPTASTPGRVSIRVAISCMVAAMTASVAPSPSSNLISAMSVLSMS